MKSRFDGKCKDCGETNAQGEEINKNKNGNWCKHGMSCPGSSSTPSAPASAPSSHVGSDDARKKNCTEFIQFLADIGCNPSDDAKARALAIVWRQR